MFKLPKLSGYIVIFLFLFFCSSSRRSQRIHPTQTDYLRLGVFYTAQKDNMQAFSCLKLPNKYIQWTVDLLLFVSWTVTLIAHLCKQNSQKLNLNLAYCCAETKKVPIIWKKMMTAMSCLIQEKRCLANIHIFPQLQSTGLPIQGGNMKG